jgi:hypothetical protein
LRMEGAVLAGETLADDLGVLVDQDGHTTAPAIFPLGHSASAPGQKP